MRLWIRHNKQLKKLSNKEIGELLEKAREALTQTDNDAGAIQNTLNELLTETNTKPAVLFSLIRTVLTWAPFSPQLNETIEILGKDVVNKRLSKAISESDSLVEI